MPASEVASATVSGQVEIEVVAWVTKFVGGDGSTRKVYQEPLQAGDTVRTTLRRLSGRFPQLHKALWDPDTGNLAEHIEVLVNDAVLDITHTLESPLQPGDRLALIGQYLGG
ncbi:MAG: MoaD/ThiS family protein [Candidatus Tectomicrobia bacterium]|uniref:MoaD/ThiS family protein n=1 Tax=Tectimicrobiota bacterium TaxID=2528274 RepID=A0A937VZT8_UNCTE|nr:MoaD/ThiS family protein [Candidatus Tectomicrobia bacterium]